MQFEGVPQAVTVPTGALLSDAARQAGIDLNMPCGGQGRCGRCAVVAHNGVGIRRRSTVRLNADDLAAGYALACQTVVEGDAVITIPPQEKIERRLVTDKTAGDSGLPFAYDPAQMQPLRAFTLTIEPPSLADQTDDWSRLKRALAAAGGPAQLFAAMPLLRRLGSLLRDADWQVTAIIETDTWDQPGGPARLIDLQPSSLSLHPFVWGVAADIGTTTVNVLLVNLLTGEVAARAAEYNGQIRRGEDIISRIIYAGKNDGLPELQALVVETLNQLIGRATRRANVNPRQIYKMTIAGNSTMLHLLLGLPPASIRLEPFVTAINQPMPLPAAELGLDIHPLAGVDCLPGVASYVGADITAGVVAAGMGHEEPLSLFLDVGTNGEMVLGNQDWLITCACSAGPAFEGAGVRDGMRATTGAIEEVWVHPDTFEPSCRVIPDPRREVRGEATPPAGLCGSGLISLLAELFITGVIDKRGNFALPPSVPPAGGGERGGRVRQGDHGPEYVVAWAAETAHGRDIALTKVDIDNLLRAKAAIYAGFSVLAQSVGVELELVERVLIGGAFGQYINVEKAVQLGLLPDVPWDRFQFLGNTSLRGALLALLNRDYRQQIAESAAKMTYLELSADNSFYDAFTSALFLPHTDMERFPSVAELLGDRNQEPGVRSQESGFPNP
ncbi:MAG: ASKHA domain-containing protein [Anaerolineae bacterium]